MFVRSRSQVKQYEASLESCSPSCIRTKALAIGLRLRCTGRPILADCFRCCVRAATKCHGLMCATHWANMCHPRTAQSKVTMRVPALTASRFGKTPDAKRLFCRPAWVPRKNLSREERLVEREFAPAVAGQPRMETDSMSFGTKSASQKQWLFGTELAHCHCRCFYAPK